jgi:hypothetical protein
MPLFGEERSTACQLGPTQTDSVAVRFRTPDAHRTPRPALKHLAPALRRSGVDVKTMKLLVLAAAFCIGQAVVAQIVSPPPICFAFNDVGSGTPTGTIAVACNQNDPTAGFVAHFVAPSGATVDQIEIWEPSGQNAVTVIDVYATTSLGGPFAGSALGTFLGDWQSAGWDPCSKWTAAPVVLAAGSTYALQLKQLSGGPQMWWYCVASCYTFSYDPTGPTPLPYQYTPGACASSLPPSGQLALPLRFRGLTCGPGPLASAQWLPGQCGGTGPYWTWANLAVSTPPVLGLPFPVTVVGPPGETAFLLWSSGVSQPGTQIAPGSPCVTLLDVPSVLALAAMGAQPLASGVLSATPTGSGGIITWNFVVPAIPSLAGLQIGAQAAVVGPSGTIPILPGVTAQMTSTYLLTLGY